MILKRIGRVSSAAYKCKTIDVDWRIKSLFEDGYFKGLFLQTPQEYPPIKGVFEQYAEVIAERFSLRGKIVLDVGTATGSLPYFMGKFGVEAVGMDISLWASKRRVCKLWIRGDCESTIQRFKLRLCDGDRRHRTPTKPRKIHRGSLQGSEEWWNSLGKDT